jgi:hypothetical protein
MRALKVMNMCQLITIYHNENKRDSKKTVVTVEPDTGVIEIQEWHQTSSNGVDSQERVFVAF